MYPSSDYFDKMIKSNEMKNDSFFYNVYSPGTSEFNSDTSGVSWSRGFCKLTGKLKCDDFDFSEPHKVSFSLPSALSCLASSLLPSDSSPRV